MNGRVRVVMAMLASGICAAQVRDPLVPAPAGASLPAAAAPGAAPKAPRRLTAEEKPRLVKEANATRSPPFSAGKDSGTVIGVPSSIATCRQRPPRMRGSIGVKNERVRRGSTEVASSTRGSRRDRANLQASPLLDS